MADVTRSAGWYPDPDGGAGQRWWNGAGWSDSRRGGAGAAASTPYAPEGTVPPPAPGMLPPSVIYSADNPAPQRPDPYAQPYPTAGVRPASSINVQANRNAMIGFVLGLVGIFANILFVVGPRAIVFSALGVVKARQLAAQGTRANLMPFAVIGLVTGAIATITGIISIIAFFSTALDLDVGSSA